MKTIIAAFGIATFAVTAQVAIAGGAPQARMPNAAVANPTTNQLRAAQLPSRAQARMPDAAVADPPTNQYKAAQQTLAFRAQNSKGMHAHELKAEEQRLDRMISDLEQGRSVDPAEVDRALERANRGAF